MKKGAELDLEKFKTLPPGTILRRLGVTWCIVEQMCPVGAKLETVVQVPKQTIYLNPSSKWFTDGLLYLWIDTG